MASQDITDQLERIALAEDFAIRSADVIEAWCDAGIGVEGVDPILQFMEAHPALDYGMPGPLVHFLEELYLKGYEERLIESVSRKPTGLTVWMLNRVINGTKEPGKKQSLVATMR
jgi:hypothetical protein